MYVVRGYNVKENFLKRKALHSSTGCNVRIATSVLDI